MSVLNGTESVNFKMVSFMWISLKNFLKLYFLKKSELPVKDSYAKSYKHIYRETLTRKEETKQPKPLAFYTSKKNMTDTTDHT